MSTSRSSIKGISVSLHCASQIDMMPQLRELEELDFDWYHVDITDGVFAPNFALGTSLVRELRDFVRKPLYVHLMTVHPEDKVDSFRDAGAEGLSFHFETTHFPYRLARQIRERGMKAGIIVTPKVRVDSLGELIHELDTITIMSVEPGYSGQSFMTFSYEKIRSLRKILDEAGSEALIEVDGGVDFDIAEKCMDLGADSIVGGFYTIFEPAGTISENYQRLLACVSGLRNA